eukprot:scaffold53145_cov17-Tisochrysis_lutea.AAC.1
MEQCQQGGVTALSTSFGSGEAAISCFATVMHVSTATLTYRPERKLPRATATRIKVEVATQACHAMLANPLDFGMQVCEYDNVLNTPFAVQVASGAAGEGGEAPPESAQAIAVAA